MNAKKFPKIVIGYARFLDPIFTDYFKSHYKKNEDWEPPARDEVLSRIELQKKEWGKYEKKILVGMCGIAQLEFYRNVIPVFIVSQWKGGFSTPLVLGSNIPPRSFC